MPVYDLRLDVPGRAFINAQLLSLMEKSGCSLWEAKKALFSREPYSSLSEDAWSNYKPHDHSLAMSLLYCLVVVPREFLALPENHQIYREFDALAVTKCFSVIEPAMDSYWFLQCLRNSVAHALFRITESNREVCYEFYTERKPLLKRAVIGHSDLMKFLSIVGQRLANDVLGQKPEARRSSS